MEDLKITLYVAYNEKGKEVWMVDKNSSNIKKYMIKNWINGSIIRFNLVIPNKNIEENLKSSWFKRW